MSLLALWADGALCDPEAHVFRADDRGATLGDGVFETIKVARGRALFLTEHLERMEEGARLFGIPFGAEAARAAVAGVLDAPAVATAGATGGDRVFALRIALSRGPGARGLTPMTGGRPVLVAALGPAPVPAPAALRLVSVRRNEGSPASRVKCASYADMILARAEAAAAGGDDALVLNNAGRVACASAANLWAKTNGGYATPPVGEGALPGVARRVILRAARARGLGVAERALTLGEAQRAGLFRSNSLLGVTPAYLPGGPRAADDDPLIRLYEELEAEEAGR